jgi:hypothetical protein
MQVGRTTPPPLTVILLLGSALGLIAGLLIGSQLATTPPPREYAALAPPVVHVAVTMPAWPTPVPTATPTPLPRPQATTPPPTPIPYYDPRWATPGRLYQKPPPPPPTPTPIRFCTDPALRSYEVCIAPVPSPTATAEPAGGPR